MSLGTLETAFQKTLQSLQSGVWPKSEDYRFTPLRNFDLDRQSSSLVNIPSSSPFPSSESTAVAEYAGEILLSSAGELSATLPTGVRVKLLAKETALPLCLEEDPGAQLASARASLQLLIEVQEQTQLDRPIRLLHQLEESSHTLLDRIVVKVGQAAHVQFIDEFEGRGRLNGKAPFISTLFEMEVGAGSHVQLSEVQNLGPHVEGLMRRFIQAQQDARVDLTVFHLGGSRIQARIVTDCIGRGSHFEILGGLRGDENQVLDAWVTSQHSVSDTSSNTRFYSVMADSARSVFNGLIRIPQEGVRTDASQRNFNMLLSPKAIIDTLPKLEIATDEVKCAHGAAISPIQTDQLVYLQSRGIPQQEAELMIVNGFTYPVIEKLLTETLRERVQSAVEQKHGLEKAGGSV